MEPDDKRGRKPELTDLVLFAFQKACSDGRLDVAEHLLVALEELADGTESGALVQAYCLLAQRTKLSPPSIGCEARAAKPQRAIGRRQNSTVG